MATYTITELMIPLADYALVSVDATLSDALEALEQARCKYDVHRYRHRAVLVRDDDGLIVGKLSILDLIRALEPDYSEHMADLNLDRFGIDDDYLAETLKTDDYWNQPLDKLCRAAAPQTVGRFMSQPTECEYIRSSATLQEAICRFVVGSHQSLLVMKDKVVVGVLRMSDVFSEICRTMREVEAG
ncbi:MAG: CBS domain-containing protein [bacterium]|nr:CBS domain-containing protein [bacterium]